MRKIRIISDGTGNTTRVMDAETGEQIDGVFRVKWSVDATGIASAQLWVWNVQIEAVADLEPIDTHVVHVSNAQ